MSKLTDKINSDYFESQNALNRRKGTIIEVFVENEDDIPFWKDIFNGFQIQTKIFPASKTSLTRGKQEVLKMANEAGSFMLLCVDSDYDYLLNGATNQSKIIKENPFIFQTYTYSIENYKCYAESLDQILVEATMNDNQDFDCATFIKKYSEIIYKLFLYSFFYEKQSQEISGSSEHIFTISDFCSIIKLTQNIDFNNNEALDTLSERVNLKIASLPTIEGNTKFLLEKELNTLGLSPENTYLFIQGHTIYENIVPLLINPFYDYSKKQKIESFKKFSRADEEKVNKINQYRNQIVNLEAVLQTHKYYHRCFLMNNIKSDIADYVSKYYKN